MQILNEVIKILVSVLQLTEQLNAQSPLLGAIPEFDSMSVVAIITALENRFGFVVEDDEIEGAIFETVGSLVAFVEQKLL